MSKMVLYIHEQETLHKLQHNLDSMPDTIGNVYWDKCFLELQEFKKELEDSYYPYREVHGQYGVWFIRSEFFHEDIDSDTLSGLWGSAFHAIDEMMFGCPASTPMDLLTKDQQVKCNCALFTCQALTAYFAQMEKLIELKSSL